MIPDPHEIDAPDEPDPPRRSWWCAWLLALFACGGTPPPVPPVTPQSPEALQVEAVITAWDERTDLPRLDATRLRTMGVIDPPTRAEYLTLCRAGNGCTEARNRCSWPGCARDIFAVVAPTRHDGSAITRGSRLSLIRHEAVHFASDIAGLGSDAGHLNRRVWPYPCSPTPRPPGHVFTATELACRASSVEERARSIANGAP